MSVLAGPNQDSIKLIMSNRMETCEFTYEWTIENFRQRTEKVIIISPSISSHYSNFNDKWILKIYPSYTDWEISSYVFVDLQLQSFNNTSQLQTKCKISINNRNEITKEYNFSKFPQQITWNNYILCSDLLNQMNGYLQNDELKICCTIIMSKKLTNKSDVISTFNRTQQLSIDLKKLLLNKKSADVTIQVGQKSFRAIKGILAVRSPVFAAMFDHEQFKENEKDEVVIEDVEEDVFEEFLHFIYTDESPKTNKMPMELVAVAEKYQVNCLKNICEEVIYETINFDNIASILVCSDKYNLKKLNDKCLKFMKKNLRAVLLNETFQVDQKKHPEVFLSVLQQLLLS
ncbi:speckle-type POZ protein B-like [Aphidius gifuensis]|uniref:speckle-type POZ protein B-like n=1 Tax=Aphidius gifuensis TaxID=684658 RepID=UPI001CDBFE41|nr:speckle-type POZ protein B-like [Aphidius gifuensis]